MIIFCAPIANIFRFLISIIKNIPGFWDLLWKNVLLYLSRCLSFEFSYRTAKFPKLGGQGVAYPKIFRFTFLGHVSLVMRDQELFHRILLIQLFKLGHHARDFGNLYGKILKFGTKFKSLSPTTGWFIGPQFWFIGRYEDNLRKDWGYFGRSYF